MFYVSASNNISRLSDNEIWSVKRLKRDKYFSLKNMQKMRRRD